MRRKGFHAGDYALAVFQPSPKSKYVYRYLQIQSAVRDGDKVRYNFLIDGMTMELPPARVFDDPERAETCVLRLNSKRERE